MNPQNANFVRTAFSNEHLLTVYAAQHSVPEMVHPVAAMRTAYSEHSLFARNTNTLMSRVLHDLHGAATFRRNVPCVAATQNCRRRSTCPTPQHGLSSQFFSVRIPFRLNRRRCIRASEALSFFFSLSLLDRFIPSACPFFPYCSHFGSSRRSKAEA